MIIILKPGISKKQETGIIKEIRKRGYRPHVMRGVARTVIGAIGDELTHANLETLTAQFPRAVESVMPIQKRYKLVSREAHPSNSTVRVREHVIGGKKLQRHQSFQALSSIGRRRVQRMANLRRRYCPNSEAIVLI